MPYRSKKRKARKRSEAIANDVAECLEIAQADARIADAPDEELFYVDTIGNSSRRRKIPKVEAANNQGLSRYEQRKINRIVSEAKRKKDIVEPSTVIDCNASKTELSDIWGETTLVKAVTYPSTAKNSLRCKKLDAYKLRASPCHPGQSYNPEQNDHEDLVAEATALELRRNEALKAERAPISKGLQPETLALLVGDDDTSSSEDSDDDDNQIELGSAKKASGKLSRAERNKQKRKLATARELRRKQAKKDARKIDISAVNSDLTALEKEKEEKRKSKKLLEKNALHVPRRTSTIKDALAIPVNLSDELHGSLCKMKPQGNLLMERVLLLKYLKIHPTRKNSGRKSRENFKISDKSKSWTSANLI